MNESFVMIPPQSPEVETLRQYFPAEDTWTYERCQFVQQARTERRDGKLFIDELLSLVPLEGAAVFPPTSSTTLSQLLFDLLSSPNTFHAHCIIYYLLLSTLPEPALAKAFVKEFMLPPDFVRVIEGFERLDSGHWKEGVAALTDPRITKPDFVEKILEVLATQPAPEERAGLVLTYWRGSCVVLEGEKELGFILDSLCDGRRKLGVAEAWRIQRKTQESDVRDRMLRRILGSCFGDNPAMLPVAHHLQTLLSTPFNTFEDSIVSSFCLSPPSTLAPRHSSLAADWRISKLVAEGRPVEAIRFGRQVSEGGLQVGADARSRLLRAVKETLTEVQRSTVELEAESSPTSSAAPVPSGSKSAPDSLIHPAWQPRPSVPTLAPIPRSLLSLTRAKTVQPVVEASPQMLPLSASPFLRREKPLVSTRDGSTLGGAQKSVLRALQEGTDTSSPKFNVNPTGSYASPSKSIPEFTMTSQIGSNSPRISSPAMSERRPTLSGFGSVRSQSTISNFTPARNNETLMEEDSIELDMEDSLLQEDTSPFSLRAALDPKISATIAAANLANSPTPVSRREHPSTIAGTKRRTFSSQHLTTLTDKRRAVSSEAEDRPSSSLSINSSTPTSTRTTRPPGAFPSATQDTEGEESDSALPVKSTLKAKDKGKGAATPTVRRKTRASSVVPSTPRGATSTPAKKRIDPTPVQETPRGIRRSTRLTTPARELEESVVAVVEKKKGSTAGRKAGSRKKE